MDVKKIKGEKNMSSIQKVEKIRKKFLPKEEDKLQKLTALNKKVHRPVRIFAYILGTIGSLILGIGMCLAMKVIGANLSFVMPLGIGVGALGILIVSINYPIYKKLLENRKKLYSSQIIEISDSLLNK